MTVAALTLESRVTAVEVTVRDDHKLLHGNGQPGLESKVNTLESDRTRLDAEIDAIKDEQDELDDKLDKITVSIATIEAKLTSLQESVNLIGEKNKWWKEILRALGWLIAMAFTVYETLGK